MKSKFQKRTTTARQSAVWLCVATALLYAACGGSPQQEPAGGAGDALKPAASAGPSDYTTNEVVASLLKDPQPAPAFSFTSLEGQTYSSVDLLGKVVLINFWATWCAPCRAEIPDLVELQERYKDHLVIIGISEDDIPPPMVLQFAQQQKMNYPIVMMTADIEKIFPGVVSLPTTFMIDREGRIAKKQAGQLNALQAEAVTRELAGLSVNAKIERVDDPGKLSAESAAQVKNIPGIDLASIPAEKRGEVLVALNDEKCTCGCDLSVAKCRIEDPSCPFSLPMAKAIAAKYAEPMKAQFAPKQ